MKRTLANAFTLKAISVKAAAAAIALTGMGGVALAASTGALPGSLDGGPPEPASTQPASAEPAGNGFGHAEDATGKATAKAAFRDAKIAEKLAKLNTPADAVHAFAGLCNAYTKGAIENPGKSKSGTAFGRLEAAAAASDNVSVADFCTLIATVAEDLKQAKTGAPDAAKGNGNGNGNGNAFGRAEEKSAAKAAVKAEQEQDKAARKAAKDDRRDARDAAKAERKAADTHGPHA